MPPLLSIQHLSVGFEQEGQFTLAVKDITFSVSPGEILAIVGESGSGKSVTALSLLQLLPRQARISGQLLFSANGMDPVDLNLLGSKDLNTIRGKAISMIFQEPMTSLNPVIPCGKQVSEVIRQHVRSDAKAARQRTIELFNEVQLPDPAAIYDRYPHQLSGGQKQRVMIAMAMSCRPALLIADEPTTALDVTVQQSILELIRTLQRQNNMAVILITHDLGIVADIADSIAVMYKGELVEKGNAADILLNPQHPYTRALLACRPSGKPKHLRLPVVGDFLNTNETPGTDRSIAADIREKEPGLKEKESVLVVKNLRVSYPAEKNRFGKTIRSFHAVDDVSFVVHKGETLGLVGESGCGKTTLGKAILQLVKTASGEILLHGKDIARINPSLFRKQRRDLQVVFQDPYGSLNPRISIGRSIMEPLLVHGLLGSDKERKDKVSDLLEKVNLSAAHFNRYPHQFSGGQRQRICIARALATDPSFLIFDESVSALDISVQAQVLNLLNDLKKEFGFTSIFISHDLSVVHYFCDRIMVMHRGKIVEEGNADELYHDPREEYTRKLIKAIPGGRLRQSS
ncbi:MAG: ABC transporter ATP-binding protein [Chitinophagaceae bacterium]|nr:ABC transporter ATP-binding protein [Chitinophagaceae bacterium]